MMVWQPHERNEWDVAIHQSLAGPEGPVAAASTGLDPFSLADPSAVAQILQAAGLADAGSHQRRAAGSAHQTGGSPRSLCSET